MRGGAQHSDSVVLTEVRMLNAAVLDLNGDLSHSNLLLLMC